MTQGGTQHKDLYLYHITRVFSYTEAGSHWFLVSFSAKYCHFFAHFVQCPTKNNVDRVLRWVFRYVGNKTFDFSSKKKGFFAQKRPNLAQNWHFWSIWARPCRLIQCPVDGSVGGCGARAVSRKTPIYFIKDANSTLFKIGVGVEDEQHLGDSLVTADSF